ncbi:IS607 family element RNA-guided endonuclease TnpB [Lentzea flava]|uniref:Transposase n=1 Tax=Lentzea flava TaxID=103732 RepID=A0ABQ2V5V0_9PSEU|nr:IS607 family element RNA-guided endonuclease TnpB [Lentzea flava]MCP2203681.1 putative transposase [Lentzea flava]GGU70224.1 transposase [Lentzea flava]
MIVHQAYRFALDPTPAQARALSTHCGAARFAFNWGLALVKAVMDQREAEKSYGIAPADLTPPLRWSLPALRKVWNQVKDDVAPWWAECSKESYSSGLDSLARALNNWTTSRDGKRKGRAVRFPRFRSKRRARRSCRFTTGGVRVEADRRHINLPKLGRIRTHESTRKLARRLEAGTARVLSATVRLEGGRWHCSFTCEVQRADPPPAQPDVVIGVDLGITHLAVLSRPLSGVTNAVGAVPNPKHFARASAALRRKSRAVSRKHGPDSRTGARPSKRWERADQRRNRIHHRVANLRRDGLHKLTTALAAGFGTIVIENLNVAGMLSNRRLARSIADAGFAEIRRQLAYKTRWRGSRLVVADRWFPSSRTCSDCGAAKAKLPLHIRVFRCDSCGLEIDRDLNAARNLAALAVSSTTGTGGTGDLEPPCSNGRGADRKTRALCGQAAVKRPDRSADLPVGCPAGASRIRSCR